MRSRAAIWIAVLATVGVACQGPVRAVPVPEMDGQTPLPSFAGGGLNGPSAISIGASPADVLRLAGEPAERRSGDWKWIYAVRAFSPRGLVPAPVLRIQFDAAGIVADWSFVDPRTERRLVVQETLAEARRFQGRFERPFCAGHLSFPGIELDVVLRRGHSTQDDVRRAIVSPGLIRPNTVTVRERPLASGVTWDYYVDRPSPLFMAPGYVVVEFTAGGVTVISYDAPFGGCE